jgi:carbamoyltransferase
MQSVMNLKIKFRESFRPFAPIVLYERAHEWFGMREGQFSPYMLLVADVLESRRLDAPNPAMEAEVQGSGDQAEGMRKLYRLRSTVPAITHVDHSARVQTIDKVRHPFLHRLISIFEQRTGCPVLINTSFNVRGEPIVGSAADAYRCFMATNMDVLVLGNWLFMKSDQPDAKEIDIKAHLAQFALD